MLCPCTFICVLVTYYKCNNNWWPIVVTLVTFITFVTSYYISAFDTANYCVRKKIVFT